MHSSRMRIARFNGHLYWRVPPGRGGCVCPGLCLGVSVSVQAGVQGVVDTPDPGADTPVDRMTDRQM